MFEKIKNKFHNYSKISILATTSTIIFIMSCFLGEGILEAFGSNNSCYKYIGCVDGFGGYDAIEHFLFGIAIIFILIWIFQKFPKFSVMQDNVWKNIFILISIVSLISVLWEFTECSYDFFRLEILHQPLFNLKLKINYLAQPSNLDTMGDFTFSLLGSLLTLFFCWFKDISSFRKNKF